MKVGTRRSVGVRGSSVSSYRPEGFRDLLAAVITRAAWDLTGQGHNRPNPVLGLEAGRWMLGEVEGNKGIGFRDACELLEVNPDVILNRIGVNEGMEELGRLTAERVSCREFREVRGEFG